MTRYSINQSVTQVEARALLTGKGRFTDDLSLARQAYGVFLRSPHAHADIVRLDTTAAEAMPGVVAILTGADWVADGLGIVGGHSRTRRRDGSPMYRPPRPGLTSDRVRHVGQAVAMVIAETVDQAKDAAEAIEVDYAALPGHYSTASANQPGTPALWDECPNNEPILVTKGDAAAVEAALAAAPHVVRDTLVVSRILASPIEPRAAIAQYDSASDSYTIYACQQRPYVWRSLLCEQTFHIPENRMRLIAGDVGGSFGMKGGLPPEVPLVAWAAKRTDRPVKWTCERSEGHVSDDQGRDMVVQSELGLDKDGKFLGYRISSNNNLGAYVSMLGQGACPSIVESIAGAYTTPALFGQAAGVLTNTGTVGNYRSPGRAPGTYVLERTIDIAARELGLDPAEIRRRNLIPPEAMPYTAAGGIVTYDCGELEAIMDKCLERADYAGVDARKQEAKARGKLLGVGICTVVDPSAGPTPETAEVRFDPSGTATVLVGTTAGGQSHATIYTQIVSDKLGIDAETIRIVEGDTDSLSWGQGTGSARVATIGGSAVFKAVEKVTEKGRKIAAHLLEAAESDIEFGGGVYTVAGTDRTIAFTDVAKAAFKPNNLPPGTEAGLYETATWQPDISNVPNACHVCEVEVDPETGTLEIVRYTEVHDVGVELNPALVDSQIYGGIAQAAGQALMEQMVYDEQTGQVLSGSFMDYCMPRAADFCAFDLGSRPFPTASNPLGVKGVGECGTVGGIATVMNAVNDALAPLGVRHVDMPTTPQRVWRAIQDAR
jgi:carbon-monoxide dehydrogenase large subunit